MARHHRTRDREPHSGAALVAASRERTRQKILSRFGAEIGSPSLLTVSRNVVRSSTASNLIDLAWCRIAL